MSLISAHLSFPKVDVTDFHNLFSQKDFDMPKILKYSSLLLSSYTAVSTHISKIQDSTMKSTRGFTRVCPSM